MVPPWLSTLASIGMAVGPPLVYADQTVSMFRKKCLFICYIMAYLYLTQSSTLEIQLVFLETYVRYCAYVMLI